MSRATPTISSSTKVPFRVIAETTQQQVETVFKRFLKDPMIAVVLLTQ